MNPLNVSTRSSRETSRSRSQSRSRASSRARSASRRGRSLSNASGIIVVENVDTAPEHAYDDIDTSDAGVRNSEKSKVKCF